MEISRLIFSKETKQKINEGLNGNQRGILRWNRIKEAENNGTLMSARNRYEVANIAGFSEENRVRGYQWVSNLIGRKHLRETMIGIANNGKMEYEYHTINDPDYNRNNAKKAKNQTINVSKPKVKGLAHPGDNEAIRERGKMLYGNLKKAAENGTLLNAKSRADVATLVGYTSDQAKAGYSWVTNLIRRGYLKESIVGITPSGKMTAEYKLGDKEPMYDYQEAKNRKMKKEEYRDAWISNHNINKEENSKEENSKEEKTIKIKISRGETSIEVEVTESDQAIKLITTILKGE